jgi:hypothetical protein
MVHRVDTFPMPAVLGRKSVPRLVWFRLDHLRHLNHGWLNIAVDGDRRPDVLVDFGRVVLHVDHVGILGVFVEFARHAVVEPHPQRDDKVGVLDGSVGLHRPVHSHHPEVLRMITRQSADPMKGTGKWHIRFFEEPPNVPLCP